MVAGGKGKSKESKGWETIAFDEWQKHRGYNTMKSIGDLSEE